MLVSFFLKGYQQEILLLKSKILTSLLLLFLRSKNNNKHAWASYPLPYKKVLFVSRGKKLQAKDFIYSFTVDLFYSKSAKKKVLRRDTKKAYSMQRKKKKLRIQKPTLIPLKQIEDLKRVGFCMLFAMLFVALIFLVLF